MISAVAVATDSAGATRQRPPAWPTEGIVPMTEPDGTRRPSATPGCAPLPPQLVEWTYVCVSELPDASTDDVLDAVMQLADWRDVVRHESVLRELIEGLR